MGATDLSVGLHGVRNMEFESRPIFQCQMPKPKCQPFDFLRFMTGRLTFDPSPSIEFRALSLSKGSGRGAQPACRQAGVDPESRSFSPFSKMGLQRKLRRTARHGRTGQIFKIEFASQRHPCRAGPGRKDAEKICPSVYSSALFSSAVNLVFGFVGIRWPS